MTLLITLLVRADFTAIVHTGELAGWDLLWLIPYRVLFFLQYAIGWRILLRPYDPHRKAGVTYLLWVTSVRDAIDRLLPVASIGGGVAGVRLLRWRGLPVAPVSATVIVEILLTLIVSYLITIVGAFLLMEVGGTGKELRWLLLALVLSLPVPTVPALLLRYGAVFERLERFIRPMVGESALSAGAPLLDQELRTCLRRGWALLITAGLQFTALISGSFEIWFSLRLFGHPVGASAAVIVESLTQALRHLAFVVPAGLGVQEAGLVLFGHALGISSELALAVSMVKRLREVLCGVPSLLSWQWAEGRRLRALNA